MNPKDDPEYDPYCDPDSPVRVKFEDILAAYKRIAGQVVRTPCPKANLSSSLGLELYLKQEFLQHTGNFKERGVRNTLLLLSDDQKKNGVVSASMGNHASALAYHCTVLGVPSAVVMPVFAPMTKRNRAERYGANVILHGQTLADAKRFAMTMAKEKKMLYINGFDHPNIVEGQGTCGIEILEQVPGVDAVLVPCGGGSLCAGIAVAIKHLKPECEVYGITSDKTYCMVESLKKNERVYITIDAPLADGLAVNRIGVNTFHTLKGTIDKMVVVREDWVARAIMRMVEEERYIVEGAGAVGVASIMAGLFPNLKGKKVVCVLSGGNIDTVVLARVLERGLSAEGRLLKFKVTVMDRPCGMADLCSLLANIGVTIRDFVAERTWVNGDVFSIELKLVVETRGWDQTKEVVEAIKRNYKDYQFSQMSERSEKPAGTKRGPCLAPSPMCMQK